MTAHQTAKRPEKDFSDVNSGSRKEGTVKWHDQKKELEQKAAEVAQYMDEFIWGKNPTIKLLSKRVGAARGDKWFENATPWTGVELALGFKSIKEKNAFLSYISDYMSAQNRWVADSAPSYYSEKFEHIIFLDERKEAVRLEIGFRSELSKHLGQLGSESNKIGDISAYYSIK